MSSLHSFLSELLRDGRVRLREMPAVSTGANSPDRAAVLGQLAALHAEESLHLAGPPLPFVPERALGAALFIGRACWFLVHRDETPADVEAALTLPPPPETPADHWTGDLLFRHLPLIHRRARILDPEDILSRRLTELLLAWPLSGILADLDTPFAENLDFGHDGLSLLFAERMVLHPRPAAVVPAVRPWVELVFAERGLVSP